jgi:hypothetical protein
MSGEIVATAEQEKAMAFMNSGKDTKVQAPAGSGKTWLLKQGSASMPERRGTYLAFNKAIADEAKATFPGNVECRTGHSLAFGAVGRKYAHRLKPLPGFKLANEFDIGATHMYPTKTAKGYLILDTIRNFCFSNDDELGVKHVPYLGKKISDIELLEFSYQELPIQAQKIMSLMMDENENIPITHDLYLKMWALGKPKINKDFLLFDEAQDANPVILGVMQNQTHMQKIFVGDQYQQIYGWRGALNAMTSVPHDCATHLSQSFRFGQPIADVANDILQKYTPHDEFPIKIIGNPDQHSVVEEITDCPDAIICRTNGGVISHIFNYIEDYKVYLQGGAYQLTSLIKGAQALKEGRKTANQELALFNNWDEVVEYSQSSSDGKALGVMIKLMDNYGADTLMDLLKQTVSKASEADVTLTTAHKAKGLEWGKVKLGDDFFYPEKEGQLLNSGEVNVLYVAATRALNVLDITRCTAANVDLVISNLQKGE